MEALLMLRRILQISKIFQFHMGLLIDFPSWIKYLREALQCRSLVDLSLSPTLLMFQEGGEKEACSYRETSKLLLMPQMTF